MYIRKKGVNCGSTHPFFPRSLKKNGGPKCQSMDYLTGSGFFEISSARRTVMRRAVASG